MSFANPFAPKRQTGYLDAIERVRRDVKQRFSLGEDVTVSVTELSCNEPGCPDLQTVIAVLRTGDKPLIGRVHKPIPKLGPKDIEAAFETAERDTSADV